MYFFRTDAMESVGRLHSGGRNLSKPCCRALPPSGELGLACPAPVQGQPWPPALCLASFSFGFSFRGNPCRHLDFDSTPGFPGKGPPLSVACLFFLTLVAAGTLIPRNTDDLRRLDRRLRPLPQGRPVQAATSSRRDVPLSGFSQWLLEVTGDWDCS